MQSVGQRISPEEAAPILGINPTRIRNLLRMDYINKTDKFPVGYAHRTISGRGNKFRYDLYKPLILKYMGLDKWPEEGEQK